MAVQDIAKRWISLWVQLDDVSKTTPVSKEYLALLLERDEEMARGHYQIAGTIQEQMDDLINLREDRLIRLIDQIREKVIEWGIVNEFEAWVERLSNPVFLTVKGGPSYVSILETGQYEPIIESEPINQSNQSF